MFGPAWHDMLESYTTLAFLAAATERVRLGTLVTAVSHRDIPLLGKIIATLDVLSGGRAQCGIAGAARCSSADRKDRQYAVADEFQHLAAESVNRAGDTIEPGVESRNDHRRGIAFR